MTDDARARMAAANAGLIQRLLESPPAPEAEGGYTLRVVETIGRSSGAPRRTPLGVMLRGGVHYLVSPVAARDWVRNLDGDPRVGLLAGSERQEFHAARAAPEEAVETVRTYLRVVEAPWALAAFPVPRDASAEAVGQALSGMAVFRLDP